MTARHGYPIWYELQSGDADAAAIFYGDVVGWAVHPADGSAGGMDYRMIDAGRSDFVGGLVNLAAATKAGGAKPAWLFYLGVDDVDATVARIAARGGGVLLPAFDLPGVGRMALVRDPQGNPFYVMRGASGERSAAFDPRAVGKCGWNELATGDQAAGNGFYADVFGWTYPDRMPMGELGDYVFAAVGDTTIGATMTAQEGAPGSWLFYFRVADIDAAAAGVAAGGGRVLMGPHEVPGGDRIVVATDPEGVRFGLVAHG